MTTWFVTRASRGLGYEIARRALDEGANVVATARNPAHVESAFAGVPAFAQRGLVVALDVSEEGQAARLFSWHYRGSARSTTDADTYLT